MLLHLRIKNYLQGIIKRRAVVLVGLLLLSFTSFKASAHAVQVGYTVLSNGFLRVYIEHWHGALSGSQLVGNGMSITTTYGTTTVTQNVNPTGAFNGYAWNNLPGAGANIHILATSAGSNHYNDWAYYDFAPAACGVPVNITLIGGLTVVLTESEPQIWPQTISATFNDNAPPTITPSNTSTTVACGVAGANVNFSATAIDNCTPNPAVTFSIPPGSFFPVGTTPVTAYSSDANGNSGQLTFNVTVSVIDNTPPVISNCPANVSVGMDQGNCSAVVNYTLPSFSDNCGIATIQQTSGLPSGASFPKGNTTNTFVVTDGSGNSANCSFVVTVTDNIAPTAVCKNISVALAADLTAGITVADVDNGSYDNCGPVVVSISSGKTQFDCNDIGKSFPVTILVTDQQGLTSSCTAQVTVTDPNSYCNQPPVAVCKALTLSANGNCQATAAAMDFDNGSSDPNGDAISFSISPAGPYNIGTTNVILTVTDSKGASSTCETTVTVIDDTKPTITAPAAVSVNNDAGKCGAVVALGTPATGDNCGVAATSNDAPASFPVGTTTVTWTVTDIHGNSSTDTQTVTVTDNEKPTITAPAAVSVNNDAGNCSAVVALGTALTGDNCGISGTTNDAPAVFPVGTTTVTWTVTDIHGNSNTATQTVTVTDNEKPVIACAGSQVFCANTGGNLNYTVPVLQQGDNCGIAGTTFTVSGATVRNGAGTDASGVFNIGVSTVTFTVTDIHNNVSSCSFTVTINPLPVAGISASTADAFCNKLTLTGNSTLTGPFGYQWLYTGGDFATTGSVDLNLINGDGVYSLYTTDANGCKSEFAATYNYQKQNLSSSYTIIAYKEAELGDYNTVAAGSVGVMSSKGEAEFGKYSKVTSAGSFVKAVKIELDKNASVSQPIRAAATPVLPTMLYNTANTRSLPNYEVKSGTVTLTGNYGNLNIKKGSVVTLTGTTFGTIHTEEGAQLTFTKSAISIDKLQLDKGPKTGYTYVHFAPNTQVLVSRSVSIGDKVFLNPENNKVTFYVGTAQDVKKDDDDRSDDAKFSVNGKDVKVTANVMMPNGRLKVNGGDEDNDSKKTPAAYVYMTGLFVATEVEGEGKNVIWSSFDCSTPPVAVTAASSMQSFIAKEETTATTEEVLKVTVMPNPSTTYFTLKLESRFEAPVSIVVMDASGRVIDAKSGLASNSTIQIGHNYISGKYYAEIIQGTTRKTVQLMKVK